MPQADPNGLGNAKTVLLTALAIFALGYIAVLVAGLLRAARAQRLSSDRAEPMTPTPGGLATGFVTNFFDTLGIGSYATTTSIFRFWKMVPDEKIPGTLNVGHTLPTIIQAFIFTQIVPVDARTLILMIAASVVGAWLGAGVVASWSRRKVQLGMGFALFGAAALLLANVLNLMPAGGEALVLTGARLGVAISVNFLLGALMTLGIGLYAPCMILVSLLGMNPTAAFPIMMGSCAFLMPVASARFVRSGRFDPRACLGLLLGGIPAVLIAAFIVKALPLTAVRWLVVVVVIYTATTLLRSAARERALLAKSATMTL
ncbi:MAG: sulfite exporter TauE/SafE family protein [Gemmatimonadales bacterium]